MTQIYFTVYDGDHGPLHEIGVPQKDGTLESLSGFTCTLYCPSAGVERVINDIENDKFQVQLTPAETQALTPGEHQVGITVENASVSPVPYKKHESYTINLLPRVET